ncbi:tRNA pseudouridine(55) synthase TruB [Psychroflexus sp. ALD_RP9]|uniref:tRNA pseudouridine(55) synthase TruB n=1 Tax=Psychroflexus sp. ALD_RP9 TaxID=2777186 RepID=UPI001A90AEDE|nr:tRNA pseudouridine(55) synthase TruB [Psychroflexus sp. ALD_RP9]QSS96069.1 tRNA pseudouridine(55) synthase TruB [Psychroflexus sp. ALD_RP9]
MPKLDLKDYKEGQVLFFDKPLNWTSFQLVNKIRWLIKREFKIKKIKVGHAGTLDPLATGLVIICTGKKTKTIQDLMGQTKVYTGEITFGATTASYDLETEINQYFETQHITEQLLHETTSKFTGKIMQQPPIFSALKKEGKRLYEFAREGKSVEIPKREVYIEEFKLTSIQGLGDQQPKATFKVVCSKGTYIRSLAHDFGKSLNSGGHLSALRRTAIGSYTVENALTIEDFEQQLSS